MNVIAEFHVEGRELLLGSALSALDELEVELEQHTADEHGFPVFFLWIDPHWTDEGELDRGTVESFEQALETDETVAETTVLDEADGRRLYRVAFATTCFYDAYRDTSAKILRLVGSRDGWTGRIRFPDRKAVLTFRRHFADRHVPFRFDRLYNESATKIEQSAMTPLWERDLGLTAAQRETVLAALAAGYYDDPRTSGIEALAEEFDVSPQAIAGRLRRAHRNLVENTLAVDTGGIDERSGKP